MNKTLIIFISLILLSSCAKQNLRNAKKSLKGNWTVTEIYSDGYQNTGELGEFSFTDDDMTYSFTHLDSLYEGSSTWTLNREKVNSGFIRVEMYTLETDGYDFVCEFGDRTSDAEKSATEVRLIFEEGIGGYSTFHLELEKE